MQGWLYGELSIQRDQAVRNHLAASMCSGVGLPERSFVPRGELVHTILSVVAALGVARSNDGWQLFLVSGSVDTATPKQTRTMELRNHLLLAAWFALGSAACQSADSDEDTTQPRSDAPSALGSDTVVELELSLPDADWDSLRQEGRSLNSVFTCMDGNFTYAKFESQLRSEGIDLGRVSVRKKGFLGSLSVVKPSLRVNVAKYQPEQRLGGRKKLVLNNSFQDHSFTHECMAYAAFREAGLAAPECSFARVSMNGEELGYFVLVEPINKPFLRSHFGDDSGELYEGNLGADFRDEQLGNFEDKQNHVGESSAVLQRVADLLAEPGDDLLERLDALIDLPQFFRFWAMEAMVAHWDGYSGDQNNFFVYLRPDTGKLAFIPWGTDNAYVREHPFLPPDGQPRSVYAAGLLAARLYAQPETRERYRKTLRTLLEDVWDESALLKEVDRIEALVPEASSADVEQQREFIRGRRAELEAELDAEASEWPFPQRTAKPCRKDGNSEIKAAFNVRFGDLEGYRPLPDGKLEIELESQPRSLSDLLVSAGPNHERRDVPTVRLLSEQPDGRYLVLEVYLGAPLTGAGEVGLHGFESFGVVGMSKGPGDFQMIGYVGDGVVQLDEVGTETGDPWRGSLEAHLVRTAVR